MFRISLVIKNSNRLGNKDIIKFIERIGSLE